MKIVSWNVAGFRACLKKGFDEFFKSIDADVYALQESKVLEDQFDYKPDGYYMYLNPAEKKGYSGNNRIRQTTFHPQSRIQHLHRCSEYRNPSGHI